MYQITYNKRKNKLLKDKSIPPKNKEVIRKFFEWEGYKLKRKEGLSEVDERSYKTLYYYTGRVLKINEWFKGKVWEDLTKEDIKKVIDDLEDGKIVNKYGKRYSDRSLYYQMFQCDFFHKLIHHTNWIFFLQTQNCRWQKLSSHNSLAFLVYVIIVFLNDRY